MSIIAQSMLHHSCLPGITLHGLGKYDPLLGKEAVCSPSTLQNYHTHVVTSLSPVRKKGTGISRKCCCHKVMEWEDFDLISLAVDLISFLVVLEEHSQNGFQINVSKCMRKIGVGWFIFNITTKVYTKKNTFHDHWRAQKLVTTPIKNIQRIIPFPLLRDGDS